MANSSITVSYSHAKPVQVDAALLTKIEKCVGSYFSGAKERILAGTPYNLNEIPDAQTANAKAADAEEKRDYDSRRKYENIAREFQKLDQISYSVVLADSTSISDIPLDELINLSNSPAERVISLAVSNGGYGENHFTIRFRDHYGTSVDFSCQSSLALARQLRACIQSHLESSTRPWWMLRNSKFIWTVWAAILALTNSSTIWSGIQTFRNGQSVEISQSETVGALQILMGSIFVGGLAIIIFMATLTKTWNWVFPKIEFVWGGGEQSWNARNRVRTFVFWTLPVVMIGGAILSTLAGQLVK